MQSILLKVIKYATGLDGPLAYRRDIMSSQGRSSLQLDESHMFEINQTNNQKKKKKTKCCETMDAPLRKVVVLIGHNGLFSINVLESARYLLILVETINEAQQE
jgi:hypothetical protein